MENDKKEKKEFNKAIDGTRMEPRVRHGIQYVG